MLEKKGKVKLAATGKRLSGIIVLRDSRGSSLGTVGVNSPGKTGWAPTCYNNTLGS